jgi:hypothetical protein
VVICIIVVTCVLCDLGNVQIISLFSLMSSIAKYTYPQIVWRDRTKKLWNPIQRKALKNRPEERVRLRIMESLIRAGWSKHRITTEEAISEIGNTSMRTDIICYTQQFEPCLLVECKAEHIPISNKTAEQVARYNQKVGAPYLLMTNGVTDYWYAIENGSEKIRELKNSPDILDRNPGIPDYVLDDWKNRGFAGSKASPDLRVWLKNILPSMWLPKEDISIQFLNFNEGPSDIDLNHYYCIESVSESRRFALTTVSTAFGGNRMIVILNEEDENRAVLEINLDLLFADKKGNTSVYTREGIRTFDLYNHIDLANVSTVDRIIEQVDQLFAEQIE